MTAFDERERAFEAKFAHDEEVQYRVGARAIRLTALWAAGLTGRSGPAAEALTLEVLHADVQHPAHADALARIEVELGDLAEPGAVRRHFAECLRQARAEAMVEA